MKKIILVLVCLLLICTMGACSEDILEGVDKVFNRLYSNDEEVARATLDELVKVLEAEDAEALKALFASNVVKDNENFDESIEALFEYYNGEFKSCSSDGSVEASCSMEYGETTESEYYSSYDVATSDDKYRIAIYEVTVDKGDSDNVGIVSLYIIRKEDDTSLGLVYRGDDKYTPGININIKNSLPDIH